MTDFNSLDKEFKSFRSKLIPEEMEGGSGAIVWSGFNSESNLLGEGSNINFFSTKIEPFFPAKHENAGDSQLHNNSDSISRVKNDRMYFGSMLNDEEPPQQSSNQIFNGFSKIPSNSAFTNCGQNGNFKAASLSEVNKANSNSFDFEKVQNINMLPQQNYFPFVIEYRKPLPSGMVAEDEPIYVNPKQYERIIKLRLKRAKAGILRGCLPNIERFKEKRARHESRSNHAKNRVRDQNGRFSSKNTQESAEQDDDQDQQLGKETRKIQKKEISKLN